MTNAANHRHEFEAIRDCVESTFDTSSRLPSTVFRTLTGPVVFCEYESVLGAGLWPALGQLASMHGDTTLYFLTLDPSPVNYYLPHYGTYASFSLDVDASPDEYWNVIAEEPRGDPTGAIVYTTDVFAIAGASGFWGCWGERKLGVALFQARTNSALDMWASRHGPFPTVESALRTYIGPAFGTQGVPQAIASTLMANY
jgi:hypothetical protein